MAYNNTIFGQMLPLIKQSISTCGKFQPRSQPGRTPHLNGRYQGTAWEGMQIAKLSQDWMATIDYYWGSEQDWLW